MPESFEEVCANIKACLNSSKNQLSLYELNRDYDSILGTKIPYQALGYSSLESLLRAVPNVRITQIGRDIFIDDKPDENTKHIANFVRDQKCSKKKSRIPNRKYGFRRSPPPRKISPPKSQYNSSNSRYGWQNSAPKQYEKPRYPTKSYDDQHSAPKQYDKPRYPTKNYDDQNTAPRQYEKPRYPTKSYDDQNYAPSFKNYQDQRPSANISVSSKICVPRDSKPSAPKYSVDPRSNAPRYNSESSNKAPKYYQVPQYNSQSNSTSYNRPKDTNQNNHSNYNNHENSKSRNRSPSPKFSPAFSDPEDVSCVDLTVNGHSKPKESLQVTSGSSRKVTVNKQNSRIIRNNLTKQNSSDEDVEHSLSNAKYLHRDRCFEDTKYLPRDCFYEDDPPAKSAPSHLRNRNLMRGGQSTLSRNVEPERPKVENNKATIRDCSSSDEDDEYYPCTNEMAKTVHAQCRFEDPTYWPKDSFSGDNPPVKSAPSYPRNSKPNRGGKSTLSRYVGPEVPESGKFKVTIQNNGPTDFIKLFYDEDRRIKR